MIIRYRFFYHNQRRHRLMHFEAWMHETFRIFRLAELNLGNQLKYSVDSAKSVSSRCTIMSKRADEDQETLLLGLYARLFTSAMHVCMTCCSSRVQTCFSLWEAFNNLTCCRQRGVACKHNNRQWPSSIRAYKPVHDWDTVQITRHSVHNDVKQLADSSETDHKTRLDRTLALWLHMCESQCTEYMKCVVSTMNLASDSVNWRDTWAEGWKGWTSTSVFRSNTHFSQTKHGIQRGQVWWCS